MDSLFARNCREEFSCRFTVLTTLLTKNSEIYDHAIIINSKLLSYKEEKIYGREAILIINKLINNKDKIQYQDGLEPGLARAQLDY